MLEFGACPRCKQDLSEERRRSHPIICQSCGWSATDNNYKQVDQGIQKKFVRTSIIFAVFLVVAFGLVVHWDRHAIEIVPLKIQQTLGFISNPGLERVIEISIERKKLDGAEEALMELSRREPEVLARLGKFQFSRKKNVEAAKTLKQFFAQGGMDLEAAYYYARALGEVKQVDESAQYYDMVLQAKPDVLQVTVVQFYVRMLMDNNRPEQAKKIIESVRKEGTTSALFMDAEFKKIQELTTASR